MTGNIGVIVIGSNRLKVSKNVFKRDLKRKPLQLGLWSGLNCPQIAEIFSYAPYDWAVIDMEHGLNDLGDVVAHLQAMNGGNISPIVRPPWNDFVTIKRLLDAGAQSFIIPYVQNRQETEAAVAATRYPPLGNRGVAGGSRASAYGNIPDYFTLCEKEICVIVQVESIQAIDEIEAIASVKGIDGIFIGPADLAASMGHLGDFYHKDVQAKIKQAVTRIKKAGKPAGILSFDPDQARKYAKLGFDFIAVGSDQSLLVEGAKALAEKFSDIK